MRCVHGDEKTLPLIRRIAFVSEPEYGVVSVDGRDVSALFERGQE